MDLYISVYQSKINLLPAFFKMGTTQGLDVKITSKNFYMKWIK
jgi:hypothetical protein